MKIIEYYWNNGSLNERELVYLYTNFDDIMKENAYIYKCILMKITIKVILN